MFATKVFGKEADLHRLSWTEQAKNYPKVLASCTVLARRLLSLQSGEAVDNRDY